MTHLLLTVGLVVMLWSRIERLPCSAADTVTMLGCLAEAKAGNVRVQLVQPWMPIERSAGVIPCLDLQFQPTRARFELVSQGLYDHYRYTCREPGKDHDPE